MSVQIWRSYPFLAQHNYLFIFVTRHQLENLPWRDTMMVGNIPTTGRRKNLPDFVLGVWSKKEAAPS